MATRIHALVLAFPLIDGGKTVLEVLLIAVSSHSCIDRSSSRWTFNCQSTKSSNFMWTYLSAASFSLGEGHGALREWSWYRWSLQLGRQLRCVSDLFLEELDGADTYDKSTR